jgi:YegS/Rv2252/BmrU family lipid kinase
LNSPISEPGHGCSNRHCALIFNPVSGSEDPNTRRRSLHELADRAGLTLFETDATVGAAPATIAALAAGATRVLVAGGDGTVAEVAGVLAGTGVSLGVIPGGTGNLLALNLGLPTHLAEAIRAGLEAEAFPTDVGRANGKMFVVNAGIGFDAHIIHEADRKLKQRFGPLAYFLAAWRHRLRSRTSYTVTIDGQRLRRRAHMIMIANLGRVTGGVELIPGSAPEGGELQVGILSARGLPNLTRVALSAVLGNKQRKNLLEIRSGRHIRIEAARPQPIQFDGNDAGTARVLEISIEPGALQLVRPALVKGEPAPPPPFPRAVRDVKRWLVPAVGVCAVIAVWGAVALRNRGRSSDVPAKEDLDG